MIDRPELGLLVAPDPAPGVGALLRVLDRWCTPRAADPTTESPAAWLATSRRAPLLNAAIDTERPVAVWITEPDDVAALTGMAWRVVLVTDAADTVRATDDAVVVGGGTDVHRFPYMAPFVRARRRVAAGLPETLVVTLGADGDMDHEVAQSALALASSAGVVGPLLIDALAWGAPCVTDAESAAAARATDGREVLVADHRDLRPVAEALAADPLMAAALSRAGRRLAERLHDRSRTPLALARRLGLVGSTPERRAVDALDDLWTPPRARIRDRVDEALAGLVAAG